MATVASSFPNAGLQQVFCVCKAPYDPTRSMIKCDNCLDWFHFACVNIKQSDVPEICSKEAYYCPSCALTRSAPLALDAFSDPVLSSLLLSGLSGPDSREATTTTSAPAVPLSILTPPGSPVPMAADSLVGHVFDAPSPAPSGSLLEADLGLGSAELAMLAPTLDGHNAQSSSFTDIADILSRAMTPPPESLSPPPPASCGTPTLESLFSAVSETASASGSSADGELLPFALDDAALGMGDMLLFCENVLAEQPAPALPAGAARAPKTPKARAKPYTKSRPAKDGKPASPQSKRDSHNVSERQRRKDLKESFTALRLHLPEICDNPKVHTGQILKHAIDHIRAMQHEEAALLAAKDALRQENARLRAQALAL